MDITEILLNAITNKTPISFSKYGDGEYFCAISRVGCNCDRDNYTEKLRDGIINSFKYMVNEKENSYIGLWNTQEVKDFWENLKTKDIKWANYHSLFICDQNIENKVKLYKSIKESKLKKIIICNELLIKAQILFNINYMINVKFNNWFDSDFNLILEDLKKIINPNEQYIIITCAGMGAKVLICELSKLFPNNIYLDFGSGLDKICTKKTSRGWEPSYEILINYLNEIIPDNWDDASFYNIYDIANQQLGRHLQ